MENQSARSAGHEEACAQVAARFPQRWLHYYAAAKLRSDPIFRTAGELLRGSREPLLDVGCGVGLLPFYLRERGFSPAITAVEIDPRKIRRARLAAEAREQAITFVEQDVSAGLPDFSGNVALLDVLHYLAPARQEALLRGLTKRVAPGGMLFIRDCPRDSSARFWLTYAGEFFAQSVSWNLGVPLHFPTRQLIRDCFALDNFTAEERPMYGRGPFNNRLFIFRRKDKSDRRSDVAG